MTSRAGLEKGGFSVQNRTVIARFNERVTMFKKGIVTRATLIAGLMGVVGVGQPVLALASDNPFAFEAVGGHYLVAAAEQGSESRCGAGPGPGGGPKGCKMMMRMDADGNGEVSREEFMKGHEAMFETIDSNSDGVIDAGERNAQMEKKRKMMGKCGE